MKKHSLLVFLAAMLVSALLVTGCKKDEEPTGPTTPGPVNTGSANFARYVSVGNSLTAGFQSNALSARDQAWSYPSQIALAVGLSGFEQPLIKNPGIGARKKLTSLTGPIIVDETGVSPTDPGSNLNGALARPYNNLGIPGAILFDMADTTDFVAKSTARANPFFAQVLRSRALGNSIVAQAKALTPTFITLWIGNNDVLGYATSGGVSGTNLTKNGPTDAPVFDFLYRNLLNELKTTGAGIVAANIPDVTSIPFFITVPWNGLVLTRQGQADSLNAAYAAVGITFSVGQNGFIAATSSSPFGFKKLTSAEFVCLTVPQDSLRLAGWGSRKPIPTQYVLTADEVAKASAAIAAFNASIDSLCRNRNIAVVDMNTILRNARTSGIYIAGLGSFTPSFITGGLFSYDGVHPSSRGYAIVANEFIKVINTKFSAQIPQVSVVAAPGMQGVGNPKVGSNEYPWANVGSLDFYVKLLTGGR